MTRPRLLVLASLVLILLTTFHLADDMVYGWEPGTWTNLWAFPIFAGWLYSTLLLNHRASGYVVMLIGSLLATAVPIIHMNGRGIGTASRVAGHIGHHFFVWTLIMLAMVGLFTVILALQGLFSREWRRPRAID